jgi:hypothetical protein
MKKLYRGSYIDASCQVSLSRSTCPAILITRLGVIALFSSFFSSPDPKGHVRYCHHLASVVRPLIFSYFNLLL